MWWRRVLNASHHHHHHWSWSDLSIRGYERGRTNVYGKRIIFGAYIYDGFQIRNINKTSGNKLKVCYTRLVECVLQSSTILHGSHSKKNPKRDPVRHPVFPLQMTFVAIRVWLFLSFIFSTQILSLSLCIKAVALKLEAETRPKSSVNKLSPLSLFYAVPAFGQPCRCNNTHSTNFRFRPPPPPLQFRFNFTAHWQYNRLDGQDQSNVAFTCF